MANQLAVRCHTQSGDEILLDANAHIYWYEAGAPEALSGVRCRVLPGERGIFTAEQVRTAFRPLNIHLAPTRLLALENTHNRGGGSIWPLPRLEEVCAVARDAGIFTHLDGARLWNASVATGIAEADYAKSVDSVSVCFSKGLGAPVGSALAGSAGFVKRARRFRKQFGGGMRQAGIIAAGALYALDHHRQRLEDDHANARQLAAGLNGIPGLRINSENVDTNIVYFDIENQDAAEIVNRLTEMNVLVLTTGPNTVRAVTSLEVDADDIEKAVEAVREVMTSSR
jgi:threonine aldolase